MLTYTVCMKNQFYQNRTSSFQKIEQLSFTDNIKGEVFQVQYQIRIFGYQYFSKIRST